jgi:hypothetical protein
MMLLANPPGSAPADDLIDSALDATGFPWVRRDTVWSIAATGSLVRELLVRPVPGGVRIEAVLLEWDEAGAQETEALDRFLRGATRGLRFARCAVDGKKVVVSCEAASGDLEIQLPLGVGGVAAACRLLSREVAALLVPELAQMYLDGGCSNGGLDEASRVTVSRPAGDRAALHERC